MRRVSYGNHGSGRKMDTRSQRRRAEFENNRQYNDLLEQYVNIAINQFEWENLPETIDAYFMEYVFVTEARCCIIKDPVFGYLSLPCTAASSQNFYYQQILWRAVSVNYDEPFLNITHWNQPMLKPLMEKYSVSDVDYKIGVVGYDNYEEYPLIDKIELHCEKMVDAWRSIDVIGKQLKLGSFFETDEKTRTSMQAAIENIDTNIIATYVGSNIAKSLNGTQNFNGDSAASRLPIAWDNLNNHESRLLTAMGVNNLHTADKKERLLTGEIKSNDEIIDYNIKHRLSQREHFIENLKTAFPDDFNDVKVSIRYKGGEEEDGDLQPYFGRSEGNEGGTSD